MKVLEMQKIQEDLELQEVPEILEVLEVQELCEDIKIASCIEIQWFTSYGNFAKEVYFAYGWSRIGKGLRRQPAQQACLRNC